MLSHGFYETRRSTYASWFQTASCSSLGRVYWDTFPFRGPFVTYSPTEWYISPNQHTNKLTMFDDDSISSQADLDQSSEIYSPLDIQAVLLCSDLPEAVKVARIHYTCQRLIDANEISRLTDPKSLGNEDPILLQQLSARRKALSPYLGSFLTCVCMCLPGAYYTLEIDPISKSVVHWEWQRMQ